jgi:simple sugar transport system permease protein
MSGLGSSSSAKTHRRRWQEAAKNHRAVTIETPIQILAFLLSLGVLIGILAALDYDPGDIVTALWDGSVGSKLSLGISASEATPLILTGAGIWLALQGGLFNIGGDGQLQLGGLAALVVVLYGGLPEIGGILVFAGLLASALAGAVWAGVAGVMKTFRGTNEIISTLMLNFVAFILIDQLMRGSLQDEDNPFTPQTRTISGEAHIGALLEGTRLTWGILVALGVAIAVVAFVQNTTSGLRLRSIGLNRDAARLSGVAVERYWLTSMLASGAICGLAGGLVLLGLRYYIAPGWASPWGFTGILIAFLALRTPYLIPLWGILFGMLASAGPVLKGSASVPNSVVTIMQTLPVIVLFLLYFAVRAMRSADLRSAFRLHTEADVRTPPSGPTVG